MTPIDMSRRTSRPDRAPDLDDEDQVLAVISEVDGVTDVVSRIEVLAVE